MLLFTCSNRPMGMEVTGPNRSVHDTFISHIVIQCCSTTTLLTFPSPLYYLSATFTLPPAEAKFVSHTPYSPLKVSVMSFNLNVSLSLTNDWPKITVHLKCCYLPFIFPKIGFSNYPRGVTSKTRTII